MSDVMRHVWALVSAILMASASGRSARAAQTINDDERVSGEITNTGDISATAAWYTIERWHSNVGAGSPPAGPRCSWDVAYFDPEDRGADVSTGSQPLYRVASSNDIIESPGDAPSGAQLEVRYAVRCPYGSGPATYRWAPLSNVIDPAVIAQAAVDEAVENIPLPTPAMWPPPEHGAPFQLGLWLAVGDPGQVNAVAQAGPVWASATARYSGTSWDMGNGDVVECAGAGTVRPAGHGVNEEGPCGYTYTGGAGGDFVGEHTVTVAGSWEVHLVTSTGRDESLGAVDSASTFSYDVYEIQTVVVG
jgi:hypothetical protein